MDFRRGGQRIRIRGRGRRATEVLDLELSADGERDVPLDGRRQLHA